MKTPRELLLKRHQQTQSKLDAIREEVVGDLVDDSRREATRPTDVSGVRGFVAEFLRPLRWHLAGMSALWLIVAVLNSEPAGVQPSMVASEKTPTPPQLLAAVRENRRQVLELIDGVVAQSAAVPQPFVPRPRSEGRIESAVV